MNATNSMAKESSSTKEELQVTSWAHEIFRVLEAMHNSAGKVTKTAVCHRSHVLAYASEMYKDPGCNLTYEEALAKAFQDLWNVAQS